MNIFDFENRLRNHTVDSKGAVDMDRLLGDLNIAPQPKSSSRKLLFLLALTSFFSISSIAYYQFTNHSTSQSTPVTNSSKIVISNVNNITQEASLAGTKLKEENATKAILVNKASTNKVNQKNNITLKATKKIKSENKKQNKKTNSQVEKVTPNIQAATSAPVSFKEYISNTSIAETSTVKKTSLIANTKTPKRSNENILLLPLLDGKLADFEAKNLADKVKDCPRFGNRLWHMSVIPEVGYSFPLKKLTLVDEQYLETFDERNQSEKTIEGLHASISLQFKNHVTGLYVKPGLSYTRITEQLDFVSTETISVTTIETISVTLTPAGDTTTTVKGPVTRDTEITSRSKVHYQLHEFSLPVAVGYSFDFKNFSLDLEGGIKFNFLQRTDGQILNGESEFTELSNQQDFFKKSVGLGFFGGAFLKKQFSAHSELYIGPRFTYNTLSFSSNSNPINQRYNIVGLHAGLVYAIF